MSVLKRALPFILTLLVGVVLGSALKRADRAERVAAPEVSSCRMRQQQVMRMSPLPSLQEDAVHLGAINYKPEPLYTRDSRPEMRGTVKLRVMLAADGTVRNIAPIWTMPGGLTEKAIEAARRIEFTPARENARPVSRYVTVVYNFNLD